ncbi:MAG: fucose isomerase, partial [Acidobacteriaceae bacterium]
MKKHLTFGVIVGNRGFFPDHLAKEGRDEILAVLDKAGIRAIALTPEQAKYGAVESHDEAKRCGDLFRGHRDEIDGIVVTLPNFGDERAIADSIRYSKLDVPVLVQATPDRRNDMKISDRRDSFCGKMSACNNLMQYGIPYSITARHTVQPDSDEFRKDLDWFSKVCRVSNGLKHLRIGAIGARPQNFNTVRYSEKLLERYGIQVLTLDLSDIFGAIDRMKDNEADVSAKLNAIKAYVPTQGIAEAALLKMAKLGVAIERFMKEWDCTVSAVQCWTSLEENFGVVPCTVMSMMSESLLPA